MLLLLLVLLLLWPEQSKAQLSLLQATRSKLRSRESPPASRSRQLTSLRQFAPSKWLRLRALSLRARSWGATVVGAQSRGTVEVTAAVVAGAAVEVVSVPACVSVGGSIVAAVVVEGTELSTISEQPTPESKSGKEEKMHVNAGLTVLAPQVRPAPLQPVPLRAERRKSGKRDGNHEQEQHPSQSEVSPARSRRQRRRGTSFRGKRAEREKEEKEAARRASHVTERHLHNRHKMPLCPD